ncbi:hypothetical protein AVEN_133523-1 [Araneus ventricosus]|uniref:Uncharacterized protein n=1 Tax=Araneus ventricosus TaxID=182803 RepID=A0A4Y2P1J6_ARAVE|nr:hypothetical protein AVEN_133523-1 [Araneus ventricosus]
MKSIYPANSFHQATTSNVCSSKESPKANETTCAIQASPEDSQLSPELSQIVKPAKALGNIDLESTTSILSVVRHVSESQQGPDDLQSDIGETTRDEIVNSIVKTHENLTVTVNNVNEENENDNVNENESVNIDDNDLQFDSFGILDRNLNWAEIVTRI